MAVTAMGMAVKGKMVDGQSSLGAHVGGVHATRKDSAMINIRSREGATRK